jgi:GxxExxY protein
MEKQIEELIHLIKTCAKNILAELGPGWNEAIYQKAMEVALRDHGVMYETQRILPITYNGHVIGESIPNLVVWLKMNGNKLALIVELKSESGIKEEFPVQVERYIHELRKQIRPNEQVHPTGLLINFIKEANNNKIKEGFEDLNGIQCLEVSA